MSSIYTRSDGTRAPIRKRKEPQPWDPSLATTGQLHNPVVNNKPISAPNPVQATKLARGPVEPNPNNNKLLAGYLAHEFLTKGTLLGKRFESGKPDLDPVRQSGPSRPANSYREVAFLLKSDGVHIPGVVNPTQLGGWLQK